MVDLVAPHQHENVRIEEVTLQIENERKQIRVRFVRHTAITIVRYLNLAHLTLLALAGTLGQLSLLNDLQLTAAITLLYSFAIVTFAQHTSIDFTIANESRTARCVSAFIWLSVYAIEFYFYKDSYKIGSFILIFVTTIMAVFSQMALLFLTQALNGDRIEEFELDDRQSAIALITFSVATFYLCILIIVFFGRH